ncbi:MAG: hypothetical protein ACXAC2_08555 [Candidatus Kariarchaeaceae archaeon]|jgi:hypothetical protein
MITQEDTSLSIYDMYVIDDSGIPIFAGCTTSDYCMQHSDQHPLHTGFITAIQSFGKEVFSGDLQNLRFPNVKINLKTVGNYSFVFVNPETSDEDLIQNKLDQVAKVFKEKYEKNVKSFYQSDEQFRNFNEDMYKLGLVPKDRLQSTKHYFVTEVGETQKESDSFIDRFKQKFVSLVKRN